MQLAMDVFPDPVPPAIVITAFGTGMATTSFSS